MNDSNLQNSKVEVSQAEQDLNSRIEMLSNIIYKLEDTKRELDTKVTLHEGHKANIKEAETKLFELLKEIETRKAIMVSTSEEMNQLNVKKVSLEKEIEGLGNVLEEKKNTALEVEKLKGFIVLLQKEMEKFKNEHESNKTKSEQDLINIKKQIKSFHDSIGLLLE